MIEMSNLSIKSKHLIWNHFSNQCFIYIYIYTHAIFKSFFEPLYLLNTCLIRFSFLMQNQPINFKLLILTTNCVAEAIFYSKWFNWDKAQWYQKRPNSSSLIKNLWLATKNTKQFHPNYSGFFSYLYRLFYQKDFFSYRLWLLCQL